MARPPWMIPVVYTEDRFDDDELGVPGGPVEFDVDERDASEIEELLSRPDRQEDDRHYECNDVSPVNYNRGPHDEEFGVDANEWDDDDPNPIDYSNGPSELEFGVEDDD